MKNSGPSRQPASLQLRSSKTTLPASMVPLATLPLCAVTLVSASAQPFRDFEGMPEPHRRQAFRRTEKSLTLCRSWALICCSFAAMSLLSRSVELIGPPMTSANWVSEQPQGGYESDSRLWRGDVTSTIIETPGKSFGEPTTTPSGLFWIVSMLWLHLFLSDRSQRSLGIVSSSFNSQMLPNSNSMFSPGAGTFAVFPDKVTFLSGILCRR